MLTLLFLTSCLFSTPQTEPPPEPLPPTDLSSFKDGLIPEYHPVLNDLRDASKYAINFVIADDLYHITGSQAVAYTNTENVDLSEVHFRLFPNILGGEMTVENVTVNGETVTPEYGLSNSLLIVSFKTPLKPNETVILGMDFKITVPRKIELNYGVQAYYEGVLALAHAYPMIAVYDDEGWNAEIPPQSGDVTYADMSFFVVTVDAPKEVTLVGSGREGSRQDNGSRQTVRYEAGPVRDFYLAASPDYEVFVKEMNGVTLRFYARGEFREGAEFALDTAARSIEIFGERYAPYPYTELDFVSTPTLALGIEYPGMIAITEWIMPPDIGYLESVVAHEVAHQWFYNLIGNDQLDDPWLDESLAQFATMQYFKDAHGDEGWEMYRAEVKGRWAYAGNQPIPVGLPVRDYTDVEYSGIVYGRGALFFTALRDEMGVEAFDAFMKSYATENAWGISAPETLQALAETKCSCDLMPLFEEWIYP
jgi:hypothetical protein